LADILAGMIRTATPILLAALGGLLCEQAGVLNIALEGMMLFGAFFGVWGMAITGSVPFAILFALAIGGIAGFLYVFLVEKLHTNPTITSIGMNVFAAGLTTYLMKIVFGDAGSVGTEGIVGLPKINIPFLQKIPFLGAIFSGHTVLVYVSILLVILISFILYRTNIGINLRSVGEKPIAAAAAGISINKYRMGAVIIGGMLCGLAGVHLSLGYVKLFSEGMTAGRGFFAYTAVVFGSATPIGALIASMVFGLAETFTYRVQQMGIPGPLVLTVPYLITILALITRSVRFTNKQKKVKQI